MLEREQEERRIGAAIASARAGAGGLLLVEGEAGIGKTSLLRFAREAAAEQRMQTLAARATELEREFPFGALRQPLEPRLRGASEAERGRLLGGAAAAAAQVLAVSPPEEVGPVEPGAIMHGLYWLIANLAESEPLLITLDDAHWADRDSLGFLAFLAPRLGELPALLMIAARPEEWEARAMFAATASDAVSRALALRPLSAEASARLAAERLGGEVDRAFAEACHRATGGNPFYLRALLDELGREGVRPSAEAASRVLTLGPSAVTQGIVARLARLSEAAPSVARAVAILGNGGATAELSAELTGLEREGVHAAAEELARAAILEDGEPLRFTHPIVRNAVYADIGRVERERLHRRAAELLERGGEAPERVGSHLMLVSPSGDEAAVATLREAARGAMVRGAASSAVAHLRRALAEPPADAERAGVLLELGLGESMTEGEAAVRHLGEALELTEQPEGRVAIARALQLALLFVARPEEAIGVLRDEHERASRAGAPKLAAALEAHLIIALTASSGANLVAEADERVERLAPQLSGETAPERVALACLAFHRLSRGVPVDEVVAPAQRALESAAVGDPGTEPEIFLVAVGTIVRCDRLELAEGWARGALEGAGRAGSVLGLASAHWLLGSIAHRRGDLDEAATQHQTALRASRDYGTPVGVLSALGGTIEAQLELGELEAADAELAASGLEYGLPDPALPSGELLESRARLRLAEGAPRAALTDFAAAAQRFRDRNDPGPGITAWRSGSALAHLRLGERDRARELAAAELEPARRLGAPRVLGIALRAAGLAEGGEPGIEMLREAASVLEGSEIRLEHARTLVELGAAIRRAGTRADARGPLREGLELAQACGAAPLAERAHEELRATGARPRKALYTGVEALTPSEKRVAQLAASGMTNREIAQELFVTVKTVEFHLAGAYRKLEISSRRELSGALADS